MKTLKITEHFYLHEFLPKKLYLSLGRLERGREFLDMRIVGALEELRTKLKKPIIVNTWHDGGNFELRGFRPFDCKIGSLFSQHKFGRAVDFNVIGMTCDEVREYIIKEHKKGINGFLKDITTLEMETPETSLEWVHMDCRDVIKVGNYLYYVYPR